MELHVFNMIEQMIYLQQYWLTMTWLLDAINFRKVVIMNSK